MNKRGLVLSAAAAAVLVSTHASACGESLYRVGKGVAYRDYSAPLPGKILMVADTDRGLAMAEIISSAGHDVHVVASVDLIGAEINGADHNFDLVISMYGEYETVQAQAALAAASVAYLPVADSDSQELAAARAINRHALSSDDRVKTYLRAIHKSLVEKTRA